MAYTPAEQKILFDRVIKLIESGSSLRSACRQKDTPNVTTFLDWCDKDEKRAERYARATLNRAEVIFEDILNIADENYKDTYVDADGLERTDHDVIQRARLRVDARKWVLAKMHPTKYGDKIDVTSDNEKIGLLPIVGMQIINQILSDDAKPETSEDPDDMF